MSESSLYLFRYVLSRWSLFCGLTISAVLSYMWVVTSKGKTSLKHKKPHKNLPGLINYSNVCFMNATLQSLSSTSLVEWLKDTNSSRNKDHCSTDCLQDTLCEIFSYLTGCLENAPTKYDASNLLMVLRQCGWSISEEEHDAHEFLHVLLTTLDDYFLVQHSHSSVHSMSFSSINPSNHIVNQDCTLDLRFLNSSRNTSNFLQENGINIPCHHKLQGFTAVSMTCCVCGQLNPLRFESFDSLSVPIITYSKYSHGISTLEHCLEKFFATESLQNVNCKGCTDTRQLRHKEQVPGQEKLHLNEPISVPHLTHLLFSRTNICEEKYFVGTKSCVEADQSSTVKSPFLKSTYISKLPQCLCIHLQRLVWRRGYPFKQEHYVKFPEYLNLEPYLLQKFLNRKSASSSKRSHPTKHLNKYNKVNATEDWNVFSKNRNVFNNKVFGNLVKPVSFNATRNFGYKTMNSEMSPAVQHLEDKQLPNNKSIFKSNLVKLKAVIIHVGPWNSQGHFIAYRRFNNGTESFWLYTSDSYVRRASLEEVMRSPAYMLFYERVI